jgi:uncharacterized protein
MEQPIATDQAETVAFLMRPATYGGAVGGVERIDTHGAMVFLAGERAYKLKRAVKLPYFDFSTPEKRRAVCERELAINRRTAPSLYLDVVAIRRDAGSTLHFGGEGEAVDWVIVMKRFPEEALLARLSAAGRLDPALMPRLARTIWRFHAEAERRLDANWLAALTRILETLDEALLGEQAVPLALNAGPYLAALRRELHARGPLLRQRQADGYVRRCHGDLHLQNIVLLDGEPVLFDAIEFDENLARIDVLYDLAFPLMDLWHRGRKAEANAVLSVYFEGDALPGEAAGLRLLPLFLSLRAAIRAMVGVHALPVVPQEQRSEAQQEIREYAAFASDLLAPQPPALVCVGGLSGTGKTTVARGLAPWIGAVPGAIHLRSEVERKVMFGAEPETPLPSDAYREEIGAKVYPRLLNKAAAILAAEHAAIVDAGFREPAQREAAARLASQAGVAFHGLWLEARPDEMIARVEQRRNDASDAGREVVLRQLQSPSPPMAPGWTTIDANGGPDQTLARARQACRLP